MQIVRPISEKDLEGLYDLAAETGPGLTSLPADKELLSIKIEKSINSFKAKPHKPSNEIYMFVLEDTSSGAILGSAAIKAKIGGYDPFYSYEIKEAHHVSKELDVDKKIPFLQLKVEHNGPSIIQSLFVSPKARRGGYGKLLSLSRFMFMAIHRERFEETVIAEMRGVITQDGYSPFWENVVRPFFDMDYNKADYLSSSSKGFIADLMPKHPIYIPLLPPEVVEIIAVVHRDTEAAAQFLCKEGFEKDNHVDIFDAGPRISAAVADLSTVKNSQVLEVSKFCADNELPASAGEYLVSNCDIDFRSMRTKGLSIDKDSLVLTEDIAKLLNLNEGDKARFIKL